MADSRAKEDIFQRELYKLIYYLQDSEYSHSTRRDMLEDVMNVLFEEGCLNAQFHTRGIKNLLEVYNGNKAVEKSLNSLPTCLDETLKTINLIFWVK